jgi:hypothetical protein
MPRSASTSIANEKASATRLEATEDSEKYIVKLSVGFCLLMVLDGGLKVSNSDCMNEVMISRS